MRRTLCALLGAISLAPVAYGAPPCAREHEYEGECRPPPACAPGCFPEAIMCRGREVREGYDAPWAKYLDQERAQVPLYDKRLDAHGWFAGQATQSHLTYVPDLELAIGVTLAFDGVNFSEGLRPSKSVQVRVRMLLDEGSDGIPNRAYDFTFSKEAADELFERGLPQIMVRARGNESPLAFLYSELEARVSTKPLEVTEQDLARYAALRGALAYQMCGSPEKIVVE